MTSPDATAVAPAADVRTIVAGGVSVQSPLALYEAASPNRLVLLSVYGSPQQTRAITALLATGTVLETEDAAGETLGLQRPEALRIRGRAVGYGKHHLLCWDDTIRESHVIWTAPEQKAARLRQALSRRKIPYDPAWLPDLEALLVAGGYLEPLAGWGPASGWLARWDDDAICTALIERYGQTRAARVTPRRKRKAEQAA